MTTKPLSQQALNAARRNPRLHAAIRVGAPRTHDWRFHGLCAGDPSPNDWNPDTYGAERIRRVVRICDHCPVTATCLADALARPDIGDDGVLGGTTPRQRKAMRAVLKRRKKAA